MVNLNNNASNLNDEFWLKMVQNVITFHHAPNQFDIKGFSLDPKQEADQWQCTLWWVENERNIHPQCLDLNHEFTTKKRLKQVSKNKSENTLGASVGSTLQEYSLHLCQSHKDGYDSPFGNNKKHEWLLEVIVTQKGTSLLKIGKKT